MLRPWPDQEIWIADIRNAMRRVRRVCAVAPTGFGKTVCFVLLARALAEKGKRVTIVAHRIEIVEQISRALDRAEVRHDVIAPGRRAFGAGVAVAMVQTLCRRAGAAGDLAATPAPDLLIVDEAHHATAGSYKALTAAWPDVFVLGVTATPQRTDGKGLGECFDTIVLGPTMRELIGRSRLADFTLLAPPQKANLTGIKTRAGDYTQEQLADAMDRQTVTGDAVAHYAQHLNGRPAIAFCVSVDHAQHVAAQFSQAGWKAAAISGDTLASVRADRIAAIGDGRLNVLASCDIISEGTDIPVVSGALLLRPTQSLIIFLQQVGRVLRPKPDGSRAIILDHVGNVFRHGMPDEARRWSLHGRSKADRPPPVRQCPRCYRAHSPAPKCPSCGHEYFVAGRPKAPIAPAVDAELVETDADRVARIRESALKDLLRHAKTYDSLAEIARIRGYDPRWAYHIMQARRAHAPEARGRSAA